ncbi:hypothetical protein [Thauera humireducens]|uniref:hypothetical protein n=1 Tax=Thauera humireducens TaxID=1134435 RepID=UPI0031200186
MDPGLQPLLASFLRGGVRSRASWRLAGSAAVSCPRACWWGRTRWDPLADALAHSAPDSRTHGVVEVTARDRHAGARAQQALEDEGRVAHDALLAAEAAAAGAAGNGQYAAA